MFTAVEHNTSGPVRGTGHYSEDGVRWWDNHAGQWVPVLPRADSLEIELQDCAGTAWSKSRVTTAAFPSTGTFRFVAVAHSADVRWPIYRSFGDTFVVTTAFLADLPPGGSWPMGMRGSLLNLGNYSQAHGWISQGVGGHPWSYRYLRPCIDDIPHVDEDTG
jgi:hypothetical protein